MNSNILHSPWFKLLYVSILTLLIYGKTISYGYVLDDDLVFKNRLVKQGITSIDDIFTSGFLEGFNGESASYRPLPLTVAALEQSVFGDNIAMRRIVHLALYILCILLLFPLLKVWFKDKNATWILAICTLFLVHPIHTEVVCNLKSLDEILVFLFFILTMLSLHKYMKGLETTWLIGALICAMMTLLSKEQGLLLLGLIPLSLKLHGGKRWKEVAKNSSFFLIPMLAYIGLRHLFLAGGSLPEEIYLFNNSFVDANLFDRIANSAWLFLFYIYKSIIPLELTWDYSYATLTLVELASVKGVFAVLSILLLIATAFFQWRKEPALTFAFIGFTLPLLAVLNLVVLIGANFAERFLFSPSLFMLIILGLLVNRMQWHQKQTKRVVAILVIGVSIAYAWLSIERVGDWKSNEQLFFASLETNPESARVQTAVGTEYRQRAEALSPSHQQEQLFVKALNHYDKAITILPEAFDAVYNKGVIYQQTGRPDIAQDYYHQVLEINPAYVSAITNLGVIAFNDGNIEVAESYFEQAYALAPDQPDALTNMGVIAQSKGRKEEAEEFYRRSLELKADQPIVIKNMRLLNE